LKKCERRRIKMAMYKKLVRDKIPEIIKGNGETPITRTLDTEEYLNELNTKLQEELKLTKEAVNESMEMVKSFKQDVDRIKERSQNLKEELTEKITIETVSKLLPVLDNFEKSFEHIVDETDKKGFKMIYNSLVQVVEKMNVEKVEVVANVFDPTKMEAITTEPTDNEDLVGTIASVYQDGYIYKPTDKVIRCTIVSVYNK
jgi:molecular chaperone GrpE